MRPRDEVPVVTTRPDVVVEAERLEGREAASIGEGTEKVGGLDGMQSSSIRFIVGGRRRRSSISSRAGVGRGDTIAERANTFEVGQRFDERAQG